MTNPEIITVGIALTASTLTNFIGAHIRENHRQEEIGLGYYSDPVLEQGVPLALNGLLAGFLGGVIEAVLSKDINAGVVVGIIGLVSILVTEPIYKLGRFVVQKVRDH